MTIITRDRYRERDRESERAHRCARNGVHAFFFIRTTNLNLSLGVLKFLAYFRLKSSYFVLNFLILDAFSHLSKRVCPSRSVGRSVRSLVVRRSDTHKLDFCTKNMILSHLEDSKVKIEQKRIIT